VRSVDCSRPPKNRLSLVPAKFVKVVSGPDVMGLTAKKEIVS
jgi:hypothetical protein